MTDTAKQTEEHPIIFNSWSIRRIIAGEKTQTRRVVKPQPPENTDEMEVAEAGSCGYHDDSGHAIYGETCPYGQPGDVLWVREVFRLPGGMEDYSPTEYLEETRGGEGVMAPICRYEADGSFSRGPELEMAREADSWGRKRPSIHMPHELCRLRLRVKDVRVERVQELSPGDAAAEGIKRRPKMNYSGEVVGEMNPVGGFKKLWNDIHGDGAWGENPWVWVLEFLQIDK